MLVLVGELFMLVSDVFFLFFFMGMSFDFGLESVFLIYFDIVLSCFNVVMILSLV